MIFKIQNGIEPELNEINEINAKFLSLLEHLLERPPLDVQWERPFLTDEGSK